MLSKPVGAALIIWALALFMQRRRETPPRCPLSILTPALTRRSKTNTENILGPAGVKRLLGQLADYGFSVPSVCIGGINTTNVQAVVAEAAGSSYGVDGVAVVSAIMGADDPEKPARQLLDVVKPALSTKRARVGAGRGSQDLSVYAGIIKSVHDATPLSHNMTNLV